MYHDNIQEYVSQAAAANFNQANSGYRPPMVSNQIRPPSFPPRSVFLMQLVKTFSIEKMTSIKNRETISTRSDLSDLPVHHPVVNHTSSHKGILLLRHTLLLPVLELSLVTLLPTLGDLKGITTRSGATIQGPKAVNHDTEVTKDTMPPANNGSTEDVQPPVVQIQSRNPNPEPNVAPVVAPIPKASIPFPSRRNDERRKEKANDQNEKFYEIFRDLSFEISFTDALMLMPKFASNFKKP
ncbi:hypothetical protein Tco_0796193 [Tanacetum coccineum]